MLTRHGHYRIAARIAVGTILQPCRRALTVSPPPTGVAHAITGVEAWSRRRPEEACGRPTTLSVYVATTPSRAWILRAVRLLDDMRAVDEAGRSGGGARALAGAAATSCLAAAFLAATFTST